MPIFWHYSPYYAPLSSSAWLFYNGILYTFLEICRFLSHLSPSRDFRLALANLSSARLSESDRALLRFFLSNINPNPSITYSRRLSKGLTETVRETGSKLSAEINTRILIRTINALDEDKEFVQFFDAIPRFWDVFHYSSTTPAKLSAEPDLTIAEAFAVFLSRSLSLTSVSMEDRSKRVIICMMAADMIQLPHSTMNVLGKCFLFGRHRFVRCLFCAFSQKQRQQTNGFMFSRDNCWRHCKRFGTRSPLGGTSQGSTRCIRGGVSNLNMVTRTLEALVCPP
jgi:hypothetical protein